MMINILGIETSCDDTGVAIVNSSHQILSNIVISQNDQHAEFKGVVPEIAARSHLNNLDIALDRALRESKLTLDNIDVIAATSGPGLIGGVVVGCVFAKALASRLNKPFIAVNHLEGHALTARLTHNLEYPYLLLLASGGHCQFIAVQSLNNYKILGATLDDAAGEAFDKVAKMLDLPFPGGPDIEKRAALGNPHQYIFPKPLINTANCNMSFSGLKTAVKLKIQEIAANSELTQNMINDIAASFQYTMCEILSAKMIIAIKEYEKIYKDRKLVIAGGVAANLALRKAITIKANMLGFDFTLIPIGLCTDNAAMIAYVGLERFKANLINDLDFSPRARWSLEELS